MMVLTATIRVHHRRARNLLDLLTRNEQRANQHSGPVEPGLNQVQGQLVRDWCFTSKTRSVGRGCRSGFVVKVYPCDFACAMSLGGVPDGHPRAQRHHHREGGP